MTFEQALAAMKGGKRVQRLRWVAYGEYVRILAISCYAPGFVRSTENGSEAIGWGASDEDLLANDWQVV